MIISKLIVTQFVDWAISFLLVFLENFINAPVYKLLKDHKNDFHVKINAYKTSISFSSSIKTNKKNCQFVFEKNVPINPCNDLCWKILLNPFPFSLNILRILLFSCLVLYDSMQPHGPGVACQDPLSIGLPRQEYWSGLPFPSQKDLPYPKIEPLSPELAGRFFTPEPQSLGRSSF